LELHSLDDSQGHTAYNIRTITKADTNYTFIRDAYDKVIATLKWRDVLPDMLMMDNGRFVSQLLVKEESLAVQFVSSIMVSPSGIVTTLVQ